MTHIEILNPDELPEGFDLVEIDCAETTSLRNFYETFARIFEFPDYFGFNLDSFDELMNDLSWVENENILIYFKNSGLFLTKERSRKKIVAVLDLLDATCEDWAWAEESELIPLKKLKIAFAPSEWIEGLFNDEG